MIENLRLSLSDLLGADYTRAVCEARALLTGENPEALRALADEKIDWYPEAFARRQEELKARGLNDSITHVDFMVGTPDLRIVGTTHDGREIPVFENGNFAQGF